MPKTLNSTVALQWGFLKRLGDVATVLLDLVCLSLSFQTDWWWWDQISVEQFIIEINGKMNVWKCKLIFSTHTLQQKNRNTLLKTILAGENASVLIILAPLCIYIYIYIYMKSSFPKRDKRQILKKMSSSCHFAVYLTYSLLHQCFMPNRYISLFKMYCKMQFFSKPL